VKVGLVSELERMLETAASHILVSLISKLKSELKNMVTHFLQSQRQSWSTKSIQERL
jgi:hypothetical protein